MDLSNKTILIVDDEELLREILRDLFECERARVLEAENGVRALELVQSGQIDVVITDARMPGGDGLTLIRNLHALQKKKPVVFLCSAFSDMSDAEAKSLGVREVFGKPFDFKTMLSLVQASIKED